MADQGNTYSRIYDLKTIGLDKIITDVNAAISAFDRLGQAKKGLNMSMNETVSSVNESVSAAAANVTKLQSAAQAAAAQSKIATQAAKESTEATMTASEALSQQRLELQYVNEQIKLLTKNIQEGKGNIDENNAKLADWTRRQQELRLEISNTTAIVKTQAKEYYATASSINEARAQSSLLRKELNDLNLTTEQGVARQKELVAQLAELDAFIATNSDKYTQRKLNIGNYPNAAAELSAVKQQMQQLVLAGEQDSVEFQRLTARAQELSAAMREVAASTGRATFSMENVSKRLETMGFRMLLHMAIFETVIRGAQAIYEWWTKDAKAAEELEKAMKQLDSSAKDSVFTEMSSAKTIASIAADVNQSMEIRLRAVDELQSKYPDYLGNLSKEAILTGQTADAMDRLNKAMLNKALSEAAKGKIGEQAKSYIELTDALEAANKEFVKQKENIKQYQKEVDNYNKNGGLQPVAGFGKEASIRANAAANDIREITSKMNAVKKEMDKYQKEANDFAAMAAPLIVSQPDKNKKDKKPTDYTNEILAARKRELDAIYEQRKIEAEKEALKNKEIYEDEKGSLDQRIAAYKAYMGNQRELLEVETEKEVEEVNTRLSAISEIKHKEAKDRTPEEKTLLLSENALLEQRKAIYEKWGLQRLKQEQETEVGITNIQKQEVQKRLDQVKYLNENSQQQEDAALTDLKNKLQSGAISYEQYTEQKKKLENRFQKERLDNLKAYLESEIATMRAAGLDISKMQEALNSVNHQISQLGISEAEESAKKTSDLQKKAIDQMMSFADQAAQSYMALLAKQDAADEKRVQRQMDYSKKTALANAQSLHDRDQIEKQFDLAQAQREKEKAARDKQRAEMEMLMQYEIAVMKAVAAHIGDFGVGAAIEIGGLTAIYGARLAELEAAPAYAEGTGSHPGGVAWVGDGYEHELLKIGNMYSVTPNTPTAVNLPAGAEVIPFSHIGNTSYSGTMGTQLQAPAFYSSNTSGGGGADPNIQALAAVVGHVMAGISNMQVSLDTHAAGRAIGNTYYKKVKL